MQATPAHTATNLRIMRKLIVLVLLICLLPAAGYAWLRYTGALGPGSLPMILNAAVGYSGGEVTSAQAHTGLQLPPGFRVSVYADRLPGARMLALTPGGDLLVSRTRSGEVVLLEQDRNGDGKADGRRVLIDRLDNPHGMDFLGDWLYIGEGGEVGRVRMDPANRKTVGAYEPVVTGLPRGGNHWRRSMRIGPDGRLYVGIGSTCNACVEENPRRAALLRFNADGSGGEILATGLRNTGDMDWSPYDGALYANDIGRDMLGDDFPPDELNRIEAGGFYGWPYYNGDSVPDPDMGPDPLADQRSPIPPVHGYRAHNTPLGIRFVDTSDWPAGYDRVAIVALHGSWNRSVPDGYKLVSLHFGDSGVEERDFLTGFRHDGRIIGRPVGVLQGTDGALYVSDDYAGAVYRITPDGDRR